mmetsp:Transcript_33956/g.76325  ORF Transcript_33956/g.76325 Transcript_33956/m.76325 type:complete len:258 (+) Transcript_33956:374-1147(+)
MKPASSDMCACGRLSSRLQARFRLSSRLQVSSRASLSSLPSSIEASCRKPSAYIRAVCSLSSQAELSLALTDRTQSEMSEFTPSSFLRSSSLENELQMFNICPRSVGLFCIEDRKLWMSFARPSSDCLYASSSTSLSRRAAMYPWHAPISDCLAASRRCTEEEAAGVSSTKLGSADMLGSELTSVCAAYSESSDDLRCDHATCTSMQALCPALAKSPTIASSRPCPASPMAIRLLPSFLFKDCKSGGWLRSVELTME